LVEKRELKTRDAVIMYAGATIFSLLVSIPLAFAEQGFFKIILGYLIPQVAYAAGIFVYLRAGNISFGEAIPLKKGIISPLLFALCIPITLAVLAQDYLIVVGFSTLMQKVGVDLSVTMPVMNNWYTVLITLIIICIFPPIFEEFMFRGVFLSSMKKRGIKYAVILSALIFALSHLNMAQLVHQFIVGVVLAYMGYKAGNILYGIIVHMLNNLLAIVLPYWDFYNKLAEFTPTNILIMVLLCIVGGAILTGCLLVFRKECNFRNKIIAYEQNSEKDKSVCYNNETCETKVLLSEDEKVDRAVNAVRENPPKLMDFWILGLCLVLGLVLLFTTFLG
jgi:membrane protease YdiL (CAAX protease family)